MHRVWPTGQLGPAEGGAAKLDTVFGKLSQPEGLTVNDVAPGGLDDDFNAPLFAMMPAKDIINAHTAVGRVGLPGDVRGVIAFLFSPRASFVSDTVLSIDGGRAAATGGRKESRAGKLESRSTKVATCFQAADLFAYGRGRQPTKHKHGFSGSLKVLCWPRQAALLLKLLTLRGLLVEETGQRWLADRAGSVRRINAVVA